MALRVRSAKQKPLPPVEVAESHMGHDNSGEFFRCCFRSEVNCGATGLCEGVQGAGPIAVTAIGLGLLRGFYTLENLGDPIENQFFFAGRGGKIFLRGGFSLAPLQSSKDIAFHRGQMFDMLGNVPAPRLRLAVGNFRREGLAQS